MYVRSFAVAGPSVNAAIHNRGGKTLDAVSVYSTRHSGLALHGVKLLFSMRASWVVSLFEFSRYDTGGYRNV